MGDRPTIYDVAREAGVAACTVSRAYARPGRVNSDTAQAVFAAAERIGYRSTKISGLSTRAPGAPAPRTGAVALMVSDITNPFYGEIIKGAEEAARLASHALLLSDTSESGSVEREVVERMLDLVDGVVLASPRMSDSSIRMIAKQKPLVLLNRRMPDTSCIVADNPRGAARALEHLGMLGHDSVTYVAGPEASWTEGARWRAVRDTARELGMRVSRIDPPGAPTMLTGQAVSRRIARETATAVLAFNDLLAVGIIMGLQRVGVRVPQDVSVIGFDNVALADVVVPALTSVVAPMRQAGAVGVGNVLALAAGARTSGETLVLPVRLVVRASTGPRRGAHRSRNSLSPARRTTMVSGSEANTAGRTDAGSR